MDRSALLREFTPELVDTIIAQAGPGTGSPLTVLEIRHLGGALDHRPEPTNAIDLRDAAFTFYTVAIGGPDQAETLHGYLTRLLQAIQPWSTGGRFVNFLGASDATAEGAAAAYPPETHERLVAPKPPHHCHLALTTDPNNGLYGASPHGGRIRGKRPL